MKNKLQKNIEALQNLEDVKQRLETLETELSYEKKLLTALLPWIEKKQETLDESGGKRLLLKLVGKEENFLEEIREEHHKMSVRANKLNSKIDLLEFEKELLKKKMVQGPSIKYQFQQLIEEGNIKKDSQYRQLLLDLKFTNVEMKDNANAKKELIGAIFLGQKTELMILQATEHIRKAALSPETIFINQNGLQTLKDRKANLQKASDMLYNIAQHIKGFGEKASHLLTAKENLEMPFFSNITEASLHQIITKSQNKHQLIKALEEYAAIRQKILKPLNTMKAKRKMLEHSFIYLKEKKVKLMGEIMDKK